jgi:hypothetical protein
MTLVQWYREYMPLASREAQREYQRQWIARRKSVWFAENGPCVRCQSWNDLTLDHIDPSQKISHSVWSWSQSKREAELAKCQILCLSCHNLKSAGEKAMGLANGRGTVSDETVREIRARVAAGERQIDVSISLGLTRGYINGIVKRRQRPDVI